MSSSVDSIINQILLSRGYKTKIQIDQFLNPDYKKLCDPYLLPDITPAVDRLVQAKNNNEIVCIYGDYDVDGLTSTALLADAFKSFGIKTINYIPDRFVEGYGVSREGLETIKNKGISLVITVDCGSKSIDEIKFAASLGIDFIVTDHHSLSDKIPQCVAVINPKRDDSRYPFKELAGVGVAFKLVQALQKRTEGLAQGQEKWLLDLVALGTTADIVTLTDENRVLVKWGIEVAKVSRRPAFKALSEVSAMAQDTIDSEIFGYRFGPRLNASGRLDTAQLSLNLLSTKSIDEAREVAAQLDDLNNQRRHQQQVIQNAAREQAKFSKDEVLVLSDKEWSHGIVGIVASKIKEEFAKPTFILQNLGKTSKGSGRSFGNFDLGKAVEHCSDLLISGGGHAMAAGVTIKSDKMDDFKKRINEYYKKLNLSQQCNLLKPKPDLLIENLNLMNKDLLVAINKLRPFGKDNPKPVFESQLRVLSHKSVGHDLAHIKLKLADSNSNEIEAIGFGLASKFDSAETSVKVLYEISENNFNGQTSIQLNLVDITN